jgi:hypothetical protein
MGDTARHGGEEYGYRLRLSAPQPDFALRVTPSSVSLRRNTTATVTVYAQRKDGFAGPIRLSLQDPPAGFSAQPVTLGPGQTMARFNLRGSAAATAQPVSLSIVGQARMGEKEITRQAVPAEDRMQAFLWRHLVPAHDLQALVIDPYYVPPARRTPPSAPAKPASMSAVAATKVTATNAVPAKAKFTKQQVASRLRQLKLLYEEGLLTDAFYLAKLAECEAAQ